MNRVNVVTPLKSLLFSAVLAATFTACSNDKASDIQGGEPPNMVSDLTEMVFVEVAIDATDVQTVTLFNVGNGDLRIDSVDLVEDTMDDAGAEFAKGSDWVSKAVLATDEFVRMSVEYTPRDKMVDSGYIRIQTNDPKYPDGVAKIPLITPALAPRIHTVDHVTFRRVPPVNADTRDNYWQIIEVQNIGQARLDVNDLLISPRESDFRYSFPQSLDIEADPATDSDTYPGELEAGESFPMRIFFNPADDMPSTAELIFYTNDPVSSEFVVDLVGNSGSPCLQLTEEERIDFGEGAIGYANSKTIVAENCSPTSDLTISAIDVCTDTEAGDCDASLDVFALNEDSLPGALPDDVAVVGPGETTSFVINYTPTDTSVSTGQLMIASDDPAKASLAVPIIGKGTDNSCPTAVAEATVAGVSRWQTEIATIPLKTIEFRGANSIDSDGTVEGYEWNIISQPNGSTTTMAPSNTVENPSLFIDLAGDYVIELIVYDDRGTQSCGEQQLITIHAVPNEDIHIQVVWDTPADPDQNDLLGTDVDLHLLHPNGNWNSSPWDCYWLNKTADWGTPGYTGDDPSLDIDDTDGAGPENINLDEPEAGMNYGIGVFYFSDWSMGPSYATLRIYIDGVQQYEEERLLQDEKEFWHVADIQDRVVNPVGTTSNGFP